MNLDQAIRILTIHNDHNPDFTDTQRQEAHQLGIEALKIVKKARDSEWMITSKILPSETKD